MGSITLTVTTAQNTRTKSLNISDENIQRMIAWMKATQGTDLTAGKAIGFWFRQIIRQAAGEAVQREKATAVISDIDVDDPDPA